MLLLQYYFRFSLFDIIPFFDFLRFIVDFSQWNVMIYYFRNKLEHFCILLKPPQPKWGGLGDRAPQLNLCFLNLPSRLPCHLCRVNTFLSICVEWHLEWIIWVRNAVQKLINYHLVVDGITPNGPTNLHFTSSFRAFKWHMQTWWCKHASAPASATKHTYWLEVKARTLGTLYNIRLF